MFDMFLNMSLSYTDSILYYNSDETRTLLPQRFKPTPKLTTKVTNNSFRA